MVLPQGIEFLKDFQIIDHHPNDSSGFSATLMQRRGTDEYTLSFRSTESRDPINGGDWYRDGIWGADGELALGGFALGQLAAMEDYYAALRADPSRLPAGATLYVTGYSLGGHLATVFTEVHGEEVAHAYVFNAPGRGAYDASAGTLADLIARYRAVRDDPTLIPPAADDPRRDTYEQAVAALATPLPDAGASLYDDPRHAWAVYTTLGEFGTGLLRPAGPLDEVREVFDRLDNGADARITHVYGRATQDDANLIAGAGISTDTEAAVYVEDQPDIAGIPDLLGGKGSVGDTHSLVLIVDTLTLVDAFQTLSPALAREEVETMFAAATARRARGGLGAEGIAEHDSLEVALDALRRIVHGSAALPGTPAVQETLGFGDLPARTAFHANVAALLEAAADLPDLRIRSLAAVPAGELAANALRGDLAWRHALVNLDPFVVEGAPGLFAPFDTDGALSNLTPAFIAARAEFQALYLAQNLDPVRFDPAAGNDLLYADGATGRTVDPAPAGANEDLAQVRFAIDQAGAQPPLQGGAQSDRLFGGRGSEVLIGGGGGDYIEAGAGEDVLYAGTPAVAEDLHVDVLVGGAGYDVYFTGAGDEILDADGRGHVYLDGRLLRDGRLDGDAWIAVDGEHRYRRDGADLLVTALANEGAVALRVRNHAAGALGIDLLAEAPVAPAAYAATDVGERLLIDAAGTTLVRASHGGVLLETVSLPGGAGTIEARAGDDEIRIEADVPGLVVHGDRVDDPAASGDDFIEIDRLRVAGALPAPDPRAGARLDGGPGDDFLSGSQRDDQLDGGGGHDFLLGNGARDVLVGGAGGDWQEGGEGVDLLAGGGDADRLHGGAGADLVAGGDGDDHLFGDAGGGHYYRTATARFWDGATGRVAPLPGFAAIVHEAAPGEAGDDHLEGGAGNDRLAGGAGNDVLDGGAGDDHLQGEAGDDRLAGGAGADDLWGDKDPQAWADDHVPTAAGAVPRLHADGRDVAGDDLLTGGAGDDRLFGGGGNDTYHYARGDGRDLIVDTAGARDLIAFGRDIAQSDVVLVPTAAGLRLDVLSEGRRTGDSVLVSGWSEPSLRIEELRFGDGGTRLLAGDAGQWAQTDIAGSGVFAGGPGFDRYVIHGGLADVFSITLEDAGGEDALSFERGAVPQLPGLPLAWITPVLAGWHADGSDLVLDVAMQSEPGIEAGRGTVRLGGWFADRGWIETIEFPDGVLDEPNSAPFATALLPRLQAPAGAPFAWEVPATTFADVDPGPLAWSARLADGAPLPAWLVFDTVSRRFTGTPAEADTALLALHVVATDRYGAQAIAPLALEAGDLNDRPLLAGALPALAATAGTPLAFEVPAGSFVDPDPWDTLAFALVDPTGRGLPDWLTFDPLTRTLGGTPGSDDIGSAWIGIRATDTRGAAVSGTLLIDVTPPPGATLGGAGADVLAGGPGNDVLSGGAGDDHLYGAGGDDTLIGGAGRDVMRGGAGTNTYVLRVPETLPGGAAEPVSRDIIELEAAGAHVIAFGAGIAASDLRVQWNGLGLELQYGTGRSVTVDGLYRTEWLDEDGQAGEVLVDDRVTELTRYRTRHADGSTRELTALLPLANQGGAAGETRTRIVPEGASSYAGGAASEFIHGRDRDEVIAAGGGDDQVSGGRGNDSLEGGAGDDNLLGQWGDDLLRGGDGSDLLAGGAGADRLEGGNGDDFYLLRRGWGREVLAETGGFDTIEIGDGDETAPVRLADLDVRRDRGDLRVDWAGGGFTVSDWFAAAAHRIESLVSIGAGSTAPADAPVEEGEPVVHLQLTAADLEALSLAHPALAAALPDALATDGTPFTLALASRFVVDPAQVFAYAAERTDGTALPAWLAFDAATATFAGTPDDADAGLLDLRVTAIAAGESVADTFTLTVREVNEAPRAGDLPDLPAARAGESYIYELPAGLFTDPDPGDVLRVEALAGGGGALPAWLAFDAATGRLAGSPAAADAGLTVVQFVATDLRGLSVAVSGTLDVQAPGVLAGGTGADRLTGTAADETLYGYGGNDTLAGAGGNDRLYGHGGNDSLDGGLGDDLLDGGAGNDQLVGRGGNDRLFGYAGTDVLNGGAGNDELAGGTGTDRLLGSTGNDRYRFARGDGADTIVEDGGTDRLLIDRVAADQLWFTRTGDDLLIRPLGTTDSISVTGWYASSARRIERIDATASGEYLTDARVQQLVSAMAIFQLPVSGEVNVVPVLLDWLEPTIAAAWLPA